MAGVEWPRDGGTFLAMPTGDVCTNHPSKGATSSFKCQQGVKQGCPLSPLLFGLYLDAIEGCLDNRKCDASALANVHVLMLLLQMASF